MAETDLEIDFNFCKDVRSFTHALNRQRKQSQKYYGYRGVKPSWVGQTYYDQPTSDFWPQQPQITAIGKASTPMARVWTKRDMYLERDNNIWPLDFRHHVGKRKREKRWNGQYVKQLERDIKTRTKKLDEACEDWWGIEFVLYSDDYPCWYTCCEGWDCDEGTERTLHEEWGSKEVDEEEWVKSTCVDESVDGAGQYYVVLDSDKDNGGIVTALDTDSDFELLGRLDCESGDELLDEEGWEILRGS